MTYDEAIKYIHSTSNFFCKPGLERIRELCLGLENPQNDLKFIHVGGTNGKGSFCAMTDSILRAAGYKVGLYTSPYVLRFNERMRVNGESISDESLARLTEKAKAIAEKMTDKPTEFELITAIAFDYFKEEGCDVVILEVGMGGRLDATNIIEGSVLSVITGIALDHTAYLGDTVEKIAAEKAGIIKNGSTVIYGGEDRSAAEVIRKKAKETDSALKETDYTSLKVLSFNLDGTTFNYKKRENLKISLLGSYQPRNAAIVIDAIDVLREKGFRIDEDDLRRGLIEAKWPARFEIINQNPMIFFDGAHNSQGICAAVEGIKEYFKEKRVIVITGVLRDKDYKAIAKTICAVSCTAFTITPDNPRALGAEEYAAEFLSHGVDATPCPDIKSAIFEAIKESKKRGCAIFCLGSLYTYGEVVSNLLS